MTHTRVLGTLHSGEVVVDRAESHLHAGAIGLLPEALAQIAAAGRTFIDETVIFDRIVGVTTRVATTDEDEIIYARRTGRAGLTRFVKNRQAVPSSRLTVVLSKRDGEPAFVCRTAFIGDKAAREPWDPDATADSIAFWSRHALIWGEEEVIPGTETSACPW
jgi:hypothetical protein